MSLFPDSTNIAAQLGNSGVKQRCKGMDLRAYCIVLLVGMHAHQGESKWV